MDEMQVLRRSAAYLLEKLIDFWISSTNLGMPFEIFHLVKESRLTFVAVFATLHLIRLPSDDIASFEDGFPWRILVRDLLLNLNLPV